MLSFSSYLKGLRKTTRILLVAVFLGMTGIFSLNVLAAPAAGGGMEFFSSAIDTLKTLVIALGAGLAVWGVINLLEGYGNDNPGAKWQSAQGSK